MSTNPPLSINLLSKRKVVYDRRSEVSTQVKVWTGIALVVYVVILVVVVGIRIVFETQLAATAAGLDKAKLSLTSTVVTEQEYRRVVSESTVISSLFSKRRESVQLWKQLQALLPADTELTAFSLNQDTLTADVKAPQVLLANNVVTLADGGFASLGVKKVTATVGRSADASYLVGFEMTLSPSQPAGGK